MNRRQQRRKALHHGPLARAGLSLSLLFSLIGLGVAILGIILYTSLTDHLPSLEALPALLDPPNGTLLQPTRLYDRSGTHVILTLENPAAAQKQYLSVDKAIPAHIPAQVVNTTLASIDPDFWTNPGYTLEGLFSGAHPTIAQRLVSSLMLEDETPGIRRNIRERLLAAQLIRRFGREKILEWYLNSAEYGPMIYGIDAASRAYLEKPANELSLAEAAFLAAAAEMPQLDPNEATQMFADRQKTILQAMVRLGNISQDEADRAIEEKINLSPVVAQSQDPTRSFTNLALEQLAGKFGLERLERGGLRIITTLNYDLQIQADCAARAQIRRMEGLSSAEENCQAARLLPTLPLDNRPIPQNLSANLGIMDPHSGQVLALAEYAYTQGLDTTDVLSAQANSPFAPQIASYDDPHPAGTLLTPFIYLNSFTRGMSPSSLLWDIPSSLPADLQDMTILSGKFHGPVSLRTAFANDYLAPALQMALQMGPENLWRTTQQFGLRSTTLDQMGQNLQKDPLLSGAKYTLLEMEQAYAVLANQGILAGQADDISQPEQDQIKPVTILSIYETNEQVVLECSERAINCLPQERPVISTQLSYLVTHVLSDETARWPSLGHPNSLEIGRPAGAKIGQTLDGKDGWTIGFTPQLIAGVWIGAGEKTSPEITSKSAAALWHAIIQYASRSLPPEGWQAPPGISTLTVCDPSGMLPTEYCPTTANEIFINGNEPTQADNLYRVFQINRETGRLATIFTPPSLVQDQVYLVVPSEAREWAEQAGLPTPPDTYDVIYAPNTTSKNAQIDSPQMFANIGGKVSITGSAGGDGFTFYRLQAGKGLNPAQWIQIGSNSSKPVAQGKLGEWDTEGLSGLYALQLQVVHQDQRVETAIIQVTVDNQAPDASILQPASQQNFTMTKDLAIVFQVSASDDVALGKVEFFVDGQLVSTFADGPFTAAWPAKTGQHIFSVKVYDQAGNMVEKTSSFSVNK